MDGAFGVVTRIVTPTLQPTQTPRPTPTSRPTPTPSPGQVIAAVKPAVVNIITATGYGSGFVFDAQGWIVTNAHVVSDTRQVTVVFGDGSKLQGEVVGRNGSVDLALIRIYPQRPLPVVALGNSASIGAGEDVVALGFPAGGAPGIVSASKGIVSSVSVFPDDVEYIQTDAAINPGNSGGPLINPEGQVVGINTRRPDTTPSGRPIQNIGYAISSNFARFWLPYLMAGYKTDTLTFTVSAGELHEIAFNAGPGTEFSFSWDADLDLNFRISDPSGRWVADELRVESGEGSLVTDATGLYSLVFDNTFSILTPKTVTLYYVIAPPGLSKSGS